MRQQNSFCAFARAFCGACLLLLWLVSVFPLGGQEQDTYAKAVESFQQRDYGTAAELFQKVETKSPGTTDSLLYAGKCYVHLQRLALAENTLRRFVAANPGSADALYLLGYALNRENKPKQSLEIYTRAAAIAPPSGDDLKIVALDYELLNDNAAAIHWLERAVAMDGKNTEAWYFLGRAYYSNARLPEARKAFERVLELDPHNAKAKNNLGLIEESNGKPEEALADYRNAIEWQQGIEHKSEQAYLNLGSLLITQGRAAEAIAPLQAAVELSNENAQCRLRLGTAYMRVGKLAQAQKELEKAVWLDPGDAMAHYQLGRYYKEVKKMDKAQAEFARVAELQSKAIEEQKKPLEK
jgi:tetratricopeptide (TPR) repeat protein